MEAYWKYLVYILKHKWHVFWHCVGLGIPWLGLIHDLGKLSLAEFGKTALYYKGTQEQSAAVADLYPYAWLHHQKFKHHWEYWVVNIPTSGNYVEAFAAQAHTSWSGWMEWLFQFGEKDVDGTFIITRDKVDRWQRQLRTPYETLPENEKESDRIEARQYLALFDESTICLPMPDRYRREMLADWRDPGFPVDDATWYRTQRHKMLLHPETRAWLESKFEGRMG